MAPTVENINAPRPVFRKPEAEDGSQIWELIRDCKPLDENSMYCNLLQCDHFADTCVVGEVEGEALGWISAYIPPSEPDTIFVWQVAVHERARGMGLGKKMLTHLLNRKECKNVTKLKTTITSDNDASWGLFRSFAKAQDGDLSHEPHYEEEDHFDGRHATENMVTIELAEEARAAAA
ncbi:diaminobutyrate acetyltransferase [Histidinibacterium aquaticum]|uniref:L-2,4-diaminobutyric acid acetyltransferase n=1 Tax=Histidinibacterium aquaticum TaxID=2613962 RepID=A0A5J5GJF0_9RHOB|nr:diaminobutyrate acetyltransferase [Histidinibacterium aquaticum]KAA9008180.1 diaminobutyrate acetyltransferase [Histidinibacterium aquaticum]